MNALDCLKKYWGYEKFRPLQAEITESVLSGKDTLALLPTGGGKSVCFQVPALVKGGLCLVVTPLIALMKDQTEQLKRRGIKAVAIFSGMSAKEIDFALDNCVYDPEMRFLYLSPERLKTEMFVARVKKMPVKLLAVDEAHCISQWGYDFRPPYMQIAEIRQYLKADVTCIALTASATEKVCQDIVKSLNFGSDYRFFRKSFARENLWYSCFEEENKAERMLKILEKVPGSSVVYVRNRAKTQQIAALLRRHDVKADYYHAGLPPEERSKKQEDWIKSQTRVIVATNAFGMGIDKPDVRTVIHLDLPDSMEAYYQEAGRAGRDGERAYPVLLYDKNDLAQLKKNTESSYPDIDKIRNCYNALGNFFNLALGGGEMQSFPFDFEIFCGNFKLQPAEAFQCLKKLEEQGFILMSDAMHTPSVLRFTVSSEELYRFQVANPKADGFIKAVVRMCGGESFSQYTRIYEDRLAKNLSMPVEKVLAGLKYLEQVGILSYVPASDKPKVTFLQGRFDAKKLPLDVIFLQERKNNALEKAETVINYARNTEKCRSLMILHTFDEKSDKDCGTCDVCLKKKKQKAVSDEELRFAVFKALENESLSKEQILKRINIAYEARIVPVLRQMLEKGEIFLTNENLYGRKKI